MKIKIFAAFLLLVTSVAAQAQGTTDASQQNINGNAPSSAFGTPFGQSFVPSSLQPLIGIALATVDNVGAGDIQILLYHSDASGTALLGDPIASGLITVAQINSYYTGGATPLWFPVYFDQPYAQTPGEHLAFAIAGGGTLSFYFANGTSYAAGRILTDGTKDLTFVTLVPEPGIVSLGCVAALALLFGRVFGHPATQVLLAPAGWRTGKNLF